MKAKHDDGTVDVVIVGSVALDSIETPFERRADLLGGSCSYACAAASFFAKTGMVGVVGDDFPAAYVKDYEHFGIDLEGLGRVSGKTFRWSGVYEPDMINRRTLVTELNVFETFAPELPARYRKSPFLLLGNISPELQGHVLEQAESPEFVVADTMNLWINIARDPLLGVVSRVDMLMLNDEEARLLTDHRNLRQAAQTLMDMGPDYVVIKKGEHGGILVSREGMFLVPAYPVENVGDPTGAGDCFAGAFLGALARAGSRTAGAVRASLLYGSVVASFGVEMFGLDRLESLDIRAIDARLAELRAMISV